MDVRTFIVEMTKALAWPAAVVTAVLLFRHHVMRLLPHLTKLKYDRFEVQFAKQVEDLERQAQATLPPISAKLGQEDVREKLVSLAMTSPEAAVIEAWRYLEGKLLESATRSKLDIAPRVRAMPAVLAALLYNGGLSRRRRTN